MTGPSLLNDVAELARRAPVDYATLAEFLNALSYPARLEILDVLRFPHTLGEIRLTPRRGALTLGRDRPAARQTVQGHLNKLLEADLIHAEDVEQGGRRVPRYTVNALKLYELTEELRRLSTIHAGRGGVGEATGSLTGVPPASRVTGPRLVLVHGVYEGKPFLLDRASAADGKWTIGRKRGLAVSLDYDPFVSVVNAHIVGGARGFRVLDHAGSKNGTTLNWEPLPKGAERELRTGDLIGVGRSLLLFLAE